MARSLLADKHPDAAALCHLPESVHSYRYRLAESLAVKKHLSRILLLALLIGAAALFYHRRVGEPPAPPQATTPVQATEPVEPSKAPAVRYPLAEAPPASATAPTVSVTPPATAPTQSAVAPALPPLDHSDATMSETLSLLIGQPALDALFNMKSFVRHVVVIVDNLSRAKLPQRDMPTKPVSGQFLVTGSDDHPRINPENYARYTPYVKLLETVNLNDLVAAYVRYYPLFQQAYVELGYPKRYFNDRLIDAIDDLLATPEVDDPEELVRPNVMYKFADPDLEGLSAGQKILLRMGPTNAERVKARLQALRKVLLAQVVRPAGTSN